MELKVSDYTIHMEQESYPDNPRDWDNIGTMVCFHKRHNLGDKHNYTSDMFSGWGDMAKELIDKKGPLIMLPLYLYEHSGMTIGTKPFHCPWDSGQVGFIFVSEEKALKEWHEKEMTDELRAKVVAQLMSEVETYDQYLSGDVYSYFIEDYSGNVIDSLGGLYGHAYAIKTAEDVIENYNKSKQLETLQV